MSDPIKKSFLARRKDGLVRYVGKRFGNENDNKLGKDVFMGGVEQAKRTLMPLEYDPSDVSSGYRGRYEDGGVAAFARAMKAAGITEEMLPALERERLLNFRILATAAFSFLIIGVYLMISAESFSGIKNGFGTSLASFIFIALSLRHDFSRWQIAQRRFGGFREYLFRK